MNKPLGPYSPFVAAGDFVFVSGQVGMLAGEVVDGGISEQTKQALANLSERLVEAGLQLSDVVKTTCFLTSMDDFAEFNEAYVTAFGDHRPARSTFAVAGLPAGAIVEVEAVAHHPK